jgi:hypothetical protein
MHLKGWQHPLPEWIIKAIECGLYKVIIHPKELDYEYLFGSAVNPSGIVITFK